MDSTTLKTIDVHAKEWRDRTYGNTYFSARIVLNYAEKDEKTLYIPFMYGGGNYVEQVALRVLIEDGLFPPEVTNNSLLSLVCRDLDITLRVHHDTGCRQREVKEWGKA